MQNTPFILACRVSLYILSGADVRAQTREALSTNDVKVVLT